MVMKFIAGTAEFTEDTSLPKTKDLIHNPVKDNKDKAAIERFFNNHKDGTVLTCQAMDYIKNKPIGQSLVIYSSNGYQWSNEVIHHFKKYDLKLDDSFIDYVLGNS